MKTTTRFFFVSVHVWLAKTMAATQGPKGAQASLHSLLRFQFRSRMVVVNSDSKTWCSSDEMSRHAVYVVNEGVRRIYVLVATREENEDHKKKRRKE
jgi:hypothetical protein